MTNIRRTLLTESSTSDGGTLYLVLPPITSEATINDIFVEVQNEMHLFNLIRGVASGVDGNQSLLQTKLFVSKSAAMELAHQRLQKYAEGNDVDGSIEA